MRPPRILPSPLEPASARPRARGSCRRGGPRVPDVPPGGLCRQLRGQTTLGLGVRARLPFRAFVLAGPGDGSRLVVDVAHLW